MAEDKLVKLANMLSEELLCSGGFEVVSPLSFETDAERILREGLKPLLDKCQALVEAFGKYHESSSGYNDLLKSAVESRAELQGWRKD